MTPRVEPEKTRGRSIRRARVDIALAALLAAVICTTAGSMLLIQVDGSRRNPTMLAETRRVAADVTRAISARLGHRL